MKSFLGVQLPVFMPDATLGTVKTLTTNQITEAGVDMMVVNTLHLLMTLGIEKMTRLGGVKKLMGWNGRILSDSGGFQVYSLVHRNASLGKVTQYGVYFTSPRDGKKFLLTPESSIDMQVAIGSDVLIMLDDCRHSEIDDKDALRSVENTSRWAERAKAHFIKTYPQLAESRKLFAVIQGGPFPELRKQSAKELTQIGFDGYCFGGWPVDGQGNLVRDVLKVTADALPDDKPKYAMGVGKPQDIQACSELGYCLFDCVLPTRNARHALLYTSEGELRITQRAYAEDTRPLDPECGCETCKTYSRAYLHHLFSVKEMTAFSLATIHNVYFFTHFVRSLSVHPERA